MVIKGNLPKGSARIKSPEVKPQGSFDSLRPVFSFEYFDYDYYRKCGKEHKAALADTVIKLSQMTWGELRQSHHKGVGFERIPLEQISGARPSILTEDVNHLHVFRYYGKCPMLGLKRDQIYYVIWLDNEMVRYNHGS